MNCLECGGKTKVINVARDVDEVLRLRECADCKTRFYTSETDVKFEDGKAAVNQIRNFNKLKNRGAKKMSNVSLTNGHIDEVKDLVEVVRCKDCKYHIAEYCTRDIKGRTHMFYMTETDFCSYGERKETE